MGLGIITQQVFEKNTLPLYGNLNFQKNLVFAYRPNGLMGKDLSDSEHLISEAFGANKKNGYTGFRSTAAQTDFKSNSDDMTVIIVGRAVDFSDEVPNRTWLASSYNTTPQSGIGSVITADPKAELFDVKMRTYFTAKSKVDDSYAQYYLPDLAITNSPSRNTGYLYCVIRLDAFKGYIDHQVINKNLHQSRSIGANYDISLNGRNGGDEGYWKLAGSNGGLIDNAPANLQQVLIYNRFLTDSEIHRQYHDDKKWLLSEHNIQL